MSEQEELLKCETLGEAVRYLKAKELHPNLTLGKYRKTLTPLLMLDELTEIHPTNILNVILMTQLLSRARKGRLELLQVLKDGGVSL